MDGSVEGPDTAPPDAGILDAGIPDAGPDACPPTPACQPFPLLVVTPAQPQAGQPATASAYDLPGWTYVDVACKGACGQVQGQWLGVQPLPGGGFHWQWSLVFPNGGAWQCAFTAESGAKTIATQAVTVQGPACVEPPSAGLVTAKSGQFWLAGKPFRFVGVNARGLVHYGGKDLLPYADAGHVEFTLQAAKAIGAKVVRVFAANEKQDHPINVQRLKTALDAAQAHGLKLIVAMTDYYPTGFFPKGDAKFYYKDPSGYDVLKPEFFTPVNGNWQSNYAPWFKFALPAVQGHPALFAWELGNEIKSPTQPGQFVQWAKQLAAAWKTIDPTHMVTVGLISTKSAALDDALAKELYASPHIDFATIHAYDGSDAEDDSAVAKALGKPFVVEEAGFAGANRGPKVDADIGKWVGKGAAGYLQWGFMATPYDNGDGDSTFGMDKVLGTHMQDWDALSEVYLKWANKL
ncbi:MAG: cellulase family glycosylhydrolase [Deltaproteobacteria bacterium]|nr:cellulase family glycosylhydrolase [Deltaproteobacteria bacterium]